MDLQHYKTFNEETTQGVVGLLRPLTLSSRRLEEGLNRENNKKVLRLDQTIFPVSATDYFFVEDEPARPIFVFKIPKEVNTLVDHEYKVAKDMEELSIYLPHFNRIFEVKRNIKCYIPENYKKNKNKVEYILYKSPEMLKFKTGKITEKEFWDFATKELKDSKLPRLEVLPIFTSKKFIILFLFLQR